MVVPEYKIMLQEHKKLIKKLNESPVLNADDLLADWSDLVSASEEFVRLFDFTVEDSAHKISDLYDEIDNLKDSIRLRNNGISITFIQCNRDLITITRCYRTVCKLSRTYHLIG